MFHFQVDDINCKKCIIVAILIFLNSYVCVSGNKKCSFFGKFGVFCFLETPVLRLTLLPYYRRYMPKNIEEAPAQALTQLSHCLANISLYNKPCEYS